MASHYFINSIARLAGAALLATSLSTLPALAQTTAAPPYQAPVVGVQNFLSDPGALVRGGDHGPSLISQIRDLAVASPTTLETIIKLITQPSFNATKEQKQNIAAGLAQAAKIVVKTNPQYATQIQLAIADTKDQDVVLAYSTAAGENPIGATGGGGAASGGASGGQTSSLFGAPTGTGTAQDIPGGSTPTNPFSYTSSVSGGSSTTNGVTTTGATNLNLTLSVSP
jgi:hypothetical protein